MDNYKLCYIEHIEDNFFQLYFSSNYIDQWGDDWDDTPAICNAEPPYEDSGYDLFSAILNTEWFYDKVFNAEHYSVKDLNAKVAPWLSLKHEDTKFHIYGGDSFRKLYKELSPEFKFYINSSDTGLLKIVNRLEDEKYKELTNEA